MRLDRVGRQGAGDQDVDPQVKLQALDPRCRAVRNADGQVGWVEANVQVGASRGISVQVQWKDRLRA